MGYTRGPRPILSVRLLPPGNLLGRELLDGAAISADRRAHRTRRGIRHDRAACPGAERRRGWREGLREEWSGRQPCGGCDQRCGHCENTACHL